MQSSEKLELLSLNSVSWAKRAAINPNAGTIPAIMNIPRLPVSPQVIVSAKISGAELCICTS